jgi:trans-2,3-dihydro-3-hydroxyanthranilate isomerase
MDLTTHAYSTLFISNLLLKTSYTKEKVSFSRWTTTVSNTFYIVDVFAERKYSGNQLAVVTKASEIADLEMQKIANEMHFSETAFVKSNKKTNNGYDVRIFTPSSEVPFAGHPTLGSAFIIRHFLAKSPSQTIILNLELGKIEVTFQQTLQENEEICWMKQIPPIFGQTFPRELFQNLLGLSASEFEPNFPIQVVSTGLPFVIVPLRTLDAVKKAMVNQTLLPTLTRQVQAGILVFCPQTYRKENNLNVRVFVDAFDIPEDPATGSGNGCLAAYLSYYQYLGSPKVDIRVEQGFEIRRPSILYLKTDKFEEKIIVQVGGKVQLIAKGKLL